MVPPLVDERDDSSVPRKGKKRGDMRNVTGQPRDPMSEWANTVIGSGLPKPRLPPGKEWEGSSFGLFSLPR